MAPDGSVVHYPVFSTRSKAARHARNHLKEKKWVCVFCTAQHNDVADMKRHVLIHIGQLKAHKMLSRGLRVELDRFAKSVGS